MKQANKNPFRRFFTSRLFFFVVGGLLLLFAFGLIRSYYQSYRIEREIDSLREEMETLRRKRLESLDFLSYVFSDSFVEEKARTELNFKKDGEHVIVVETGTGAEPASLPAMAPAPLQTLSNPLKWWYYFTT